jgi:molecular chaperone DnaJ
LAENKRDFYEVLGLDRSATDDQIKKAYRQLAKKYHPDLNPGDKTAEENFKEVSEAYAVLSDADKKSKYDQFGHAGVDPNFGAGGGGGFGGFNMDFGDFGDIFSSFFGGGGRRANPNAPRQGSDAEVDVVVSFEEAAFGCEKQVNVTRIEECSTCHGSGAKEGTQPTTCPICHGTGQIHVQQRTAFGVMQTQRACDRCRGKGKIIEQPCKTCNGKGKIRHTLKQTVKIPAGIDDGQTFIIRGAGNAGDNGGPAGDLRVYVSVRPHALFDRRGFDVWCDFPLTFSQAALGDEIVVPTLDGNVKYTIPEGIQPGDVFKLKGKGIYRVNSSLRGDQYVRVILEVPKNLSSKQKDILREFDKSVSDNNYKNRKSFFNKVKSAFKND